MTSTIVIGVTARTEVAVAVALSGTAAGPRFRARREIELIPPGLAAQPYHAAAGMDLVIAGKFGRDSDGAAPIEVITFETSAKCSISSISADGRLDVRAGPNGSTGPPGFPACLTAGWHVAGGRGRRRRGCCGLFRASRRTRPCTA